MSNKFHVRIEFTVALVAVGATAALWIHSRTFESGAALISAIAVGLGALSHLAYVEWSLRGLSNRQAPSALALGPALASPEQFAPRREPLPEERILSEIKCPACKGTGNAWAIDPSPCGKCAGRTTIKTFRAGQPRCAPCKGTGRLSGILPEYCPVCDGVGLLPFEVADQG